MEKLLILYMVSYFTHAAHDMSESILHDTITDVPGNMTCPPLPSGYHHDNVNRIVGCAFNNQSQLCDGVSVTSQEANGSLLFSTDMQSANAPVAVSFNQEIGPGFVYFNRSSSSSQEEGRLNIALNSAVHFTDIENFDFLVSFAYFEPNSRYGQLHLETIIDDSLAQNWVTNGEDFSSPEWKFNTIRVDSGSLADPHINFTYRVVSANTDQPVIMIDDICIYQVCKIGFQFNDLSGHCEHEDECIICDKDANVTDSTDMCYGFKECFLSNDSVSIDYRSCTNTPHSWECNCRPGYKNTPDNENEMVGDFVYSVCENINECYPDPCNNENDVDGDGDLDSFFVCIDLSPTEANPERFSCNCDRNVYNTLNGTCRARQPCDDSRCPGNNTRCVLVEEVETCLCEDGYETFGSACIDIDECGRLNDCDSISSECKNVPGSYKCACKNGFVSDAYSSLGICNDVDECTQSEIDLCDTMGETCSNTKGSYTCVCAIGYTNDTGTCKDVNECTEANPCSSEVFDPSFDTCNNTIGSYTCLCPPGFYEPYAYNNYMCSDIDECTTNTHTCTAGAFCVNGLGNFSCFCIPGFKSNFNISTTLFIESEEDLCQNIDECDSKPCPDDAQCYDMTDAFYCDCPTGLVHNVSTNQCEDRLLCNQVSNGCDNSRGGCNGTEDSFICYCNPGYDIDDDSNCLDIDECSSARVCDVKATCENTIGGYRCKCSPGYEGNGYLAMDPTYDYPIGVEEGTECTDINECDDSSVCAGRGHCVNEEGSYECSCTDGYETVGGSCVDIDECDRGAASCSVKSKCRNTKGSYECECLEHYATESCLYEGHWGRWKSDDSCTQTCDVGKQSQTRECVDYEVNEADSCPPEDGEQRLNSRTGECNTIACGDAMVVAKDVDICSNFADVETPGDLEILAKPVMDFKPMLRAMFKKWAQLDVQTSSCSSIPALTQDISESMRFIDEKYKLAKKIDGEMKTLTYCGSMVDASVYGRANMKVRSFVIEMKRHLDALRGVEIEFIKKSANCQ